MKNKQFLGLTKNPVFKKRFAFEAVKAFYEGFVDGRMEGTERAHAVPQTIKGFRCCKSNYKVWKLIENSKKFLDHFQIVRQGLWNANQKGISNRSKRHYISGYVNAFELSAFNYAHDDSELFYHAYVIGYKEGHDADIAHLEKDVRVPVLNGKKVFDMVEAEAKKFAYDKINVDYCLEKKYCYTQIANFLYGCKIGYVDGYIKSYFTRVSEDNDVESMVTNNFGA